MERNELKKRVDKLSPARRALLANQLARPEKDHEGHKFRRVVAYVSGDAAVNAAYLREKLRETLPAYMVPAVFVMLDKMPRLPNGKVDSHALPAPNEAVTMTESGYVSPRSSVEQQLVAIWEEVLNTRPVGISDNFFEIGGDSILSIQIVSRARKAGLIIGPNQLFEHQTIAELSLFIQPESFAESHTTAELSGIVPLTPIQRWFFEEHKAAPHYWNQVMRFSLQPEISATRIADAFAKLTKHHDAFRLTYTVKDNHWISEIANYKGGLGFRHIDLTRCTNDEQNENIAAGVRAVQSNFNLAEGPLVQALFFECQPSADNQLMLIAHHLVVDAVSWQIILGQLETLLNEPYAILQKTAAFQAWSEHLTKAAELRKFDSEIPFWEKQEQNPSNLPTDQPVILPVTEDTIETVAYTLDARNTTLLIKDALAAYRMRPEEILITAFLIAVEKWCGLRTLTLWFERHGRQLPEMTIDLSSTVGWFTAFYPQQLHYDPGADHGGALMQVKEQLRQVPNGGVGYGVLRYLNPGATEMRRRTQHPLVIFNYLGNQTKVSSGPLGVATMELSGARAAKSERYCQLEINAYIQDGQLQMKWSFSHSHYRTTTIKSLTEHFSTTLRDLISHCVAGGSGGYTPSDFPEAGLSQEDLDALLNKL